MEIAVLAPARPWTHWGRVTVRVDAPAASAWTSAFAVVAYLALRNGGYDTVVYSQVGVAAWWLVLLLALVGVLSGRIGRAGWAAIGLLGAFVAWTAVAVGWSENVESTVLDLGRVAAYLGILVLAIVLQGRTAVRHAINGLACAIGLVIVLAVLSRLHPQAFPPNHSFQFLGAASARRLSYPINYWNGLAALVAIGVPLLMAVAVGARTIAARALAAGTLPICALCLYLTISRGGVLELAFGLAVFLIVVPRRLEAAATFLVSGAGAAILVWAASRRPAVTSGLPAATEIHQGTQLLVLVVIVCAGVALLQVAIAVAGRHFDRPALLKPGRRGTAQRALALAGVAAVIAVAAGAPGRIEHAWQVFKQPNGVVTPGSDNSVFSRLSVANGNDRYQFWQAALHADETNPWVGIGPGTFRFWWAQHPTSPAFVLNAHSLYFETLAETGITGFCLLVGLLVLFVAVAVRRLLRGPPDQRLWIAAALGGLSAFLAAAALEWVWQLAAIAAAALILGGGIVAGGEGPLVEDAAPGTVASTAARLAPRAALAVLAIAGLGAVLVPLAGTVAVAKSRAAASHGDLATAYRDSVVAERLQPYAETPRLQEALVLEAAGELGAAAAAARAATDRGPTDSDAWLTLARIDARRGATRAAVAELRRARLLAPGSTLFGQP
jgi:hypothetical protein